MNVAKGTKRFANNSQLKTAILKQFNKTYSDIDLNYAEVKKNTKTVFWTFPENI